jgi:acetyl-CoA carboxylase biotin carboxylase subunit
MPVKDWRYTGRDVTTNTMTRKINKILVANRGEIAVRIMRTCREMGIGTAAVYSDADAGALHVLHADEAVGLGDPDPQKSYLDIGKIIEAAKKTGAEAIHPGYGFLAENPRFAEACRDEGIVFIGPSPEAIRAMGDKVVARKLAAKEGVPVVPGALRSERDPDLLAAEAEKFGFPLIIKAALGGGGKGMRIVRSGGELKEALARASGEAQKAFGDGSIYFEKYLQGPHHVEFQILADGRGSCIHLFERECSVQRRYQKIIEESPSPILTDGLRKDMSEAALAVVRAAGYENAGTVEFLVDEEGSFYFMEMNTRIQVEHTVTEMRTGIDLVRKQIEIASGEDLGLRQEEVRPVGHAIECRIYAEDPENSFYPSPGRITVLEEPSGSGVRVDSGIRQGSLVPVEYDPILSKLIVLAGRRDHAARRMLRALREYVVLGIKTIIPFLIDVLDSMEFREGRTTTDFLDNHFPAWKQGDALLDVAVIAYVAHELSAARPDDEAQAPRERPRFSSPWQTLGRWRLG